MRLNGSLFCIRDIERTAEGHTVTAEIFPGHEIFKGHFPSRPVVPGVCTLSLIRESLAEILGHEVVFRKISSCKFLRPLIPEASLDISLYLKLQDSRLTACVEHGEETVLKLKAEIAAL